MVILPKNKASVSVTTPLPVSLSWTSRGYTARGFHNGKEPPRYILAILQVFGSGQAYFLALRTPTNWLRQFAHYNIWSKQCKQIISSRGEATCLIDRFLASISHGSPIAPPKGKKVNASQVSQVSQANWAFSSFPYFLFFL